METFSAPERAIQQRQEIAREPASVRRPRFPRTPLEREDAFIDPAREIQLLLPEQALSSSSALFENALATMKSQPSSGQPSAFASLYEYLLSLFSAVKRRLRGGARRRARLTANGEEALDQLRYLAMLCDAAECRTPEEVLLAEGAFGEAYHGIMALSSDLERMAEREQEHHLRHYRKHFSSVLRSTD